MAEDSGYEFESGTNNPKSKEDFLKKKKFNFKWNKYFFLSFFVVKKYQLKCIHLQFMTIYSIYWPTFTDIRYHRNCIQLQCKWNMIDETKMLLYKIKQKTLSTEEFFQTKFSIKRNHSNNSNLSRKICETTSNQSWLVR